MSQCLADTDSCSCNLQNEEHIKSTSTNNVDPVPSPAFGRPWAKKTMEAPKPCPDVDVLKPRL